MTRLQCPQCGANKVDHDDYEKLLVCEHCSSIFLIENIAKIKHSLILQRKQIIIRGKHYKLVEASDLKHDRGITTEWLIQDQDNNLFVLSEDDENFSMVKKIKVGLDENIRCNSLQVNTEIKLLGKDWLVTENIDYTVPDVADFQYSYLTGENAELLILIFQNNSITCRLGFWLDAFEINQ